MSIRLELYRRQIYTHCFFKPLTLWGLFATAGQPSPTLTYVLKKALLPFLSYMRVRGTGSELLVATVWQRFCFCFQCKENEHPRRKSCKGYKGPLNDIHSFIYSFHKHCPSPSVCKKAVRCLPPIPNIVCPPYTHPAQDVFRNHGPEMKCEFLVTCFNVWAVEGEQ